MNGLRKEQASTDPYVAHESFLLSINAFELFKKFRLESNEGAIKRRE